ncbi:MAG: aspartate/glutamate racemase family protein [Erysipelotrichaceae bacterium]|nr:aspartate/glutamate racemase family protein [Erysipelotrichaceae bacterium]MDP3305698.1 aspartate/glutamate racemase family protein [Erysipelotrichaceae bacterium]
MKTIGLIGGMSYESTADYYKIINRLINLHYGGHTSAKIVLYSVDFGEIERYQSEGKWEESARVLIDAAVKLESIGADMIALCTNTMHIVADDIQENIYIPFVHIADVTARRICSKNIKKVGLMATRYTMEMDFYVERLKKFDLEVVLPDQNERKVINDIIFNELVHGIIDEQSKENFIAIANDLVSKGCEGIILGCTEIGMLVKPEDLDISLFDTTQIHCETLVQLAIQ